MTRPSFDEIFSKFAQLVAQRSTCQRLQVGTVITTVDHRQVLAIGYNGNAVGLPNCCDELAEGSCGCLHSEENAIINCNSSRHVAKYVYVTHLPCSMCAKRLINLGGVQRIIYQTDYRSHDSIAIFEQAGIEVYKLRKAND